MNHYEQQNKFEGKSGSVESEVLTDESKLETPKQTHKDTKEEVKIVEDLIESETKTYNSVREELGLEKEENPKTNSLDQLKDKKDALMNENGEVKRQEEMEKMKVQIREFSNTFADLKDVVRSDKDGILGENFRGKVGGSLDQIDRIAENSSKYGFKSIEDVSKIVCATMNRLGEGSRNIPTKETSRTLEKARIALENIASKIDKMAGFSNESEQSDLKDQYQSVMRMRRSLGKAVDFVDRLKSAVNRMVR